MPLPPRNHEINPAENLWTNMRKTQLANRSFRIIDDITDACCDAWNAVPDAPSRIKSIGSFPWIGTAQNL